MGLNIHTLRRAYRTTAVISFNTFVAVVVVNLLLWAVFSFRDAPVSTRVDIPPAPVTASGLFREDGTAVDNGKRTASNLTIFDFKSFEGVLSEPEIAALLDEYYVHHRQHGFSYQPFTQYGHRTFDGKYLNVHRLDNGLTVRRTINPPMAETDVQPIRIFAFGGSTTFGSGLADSQTWPSQLSHILNARAREMGLGVPIEVVNYGRVGFYPTQELYLLMDVLRSGARPQMAIFLDGVNFGRVDDTPNLTTDYHRIVDKAQLGGVQALDALPMMRAVNYFTRAPGSVLPPARYEVDHLVTRFLQFKETATLIAEHHGIEALFILQPDGHYNYPAHRYSTGRPVNSEASRALKAAFYGAFPEDHGFVDMTGLFEKWGDRKALMDAAHYSPNFARFVAQEIAALVDLETLKQRRRPDAAPTGTPRRQ